MMKHLLILILLVFTNSYHCPTEHPYTDKFQGTITFGMCVCDLIGFRGIMDTANERCFCYPTYEVKGCLDDPNCKINANVMCVNA